MAHDELLPFCRRLAADIVTNDQDAVRHLLGTYGQVIDAAHGSGWAVESQRAAAYPGNQWDPEEIARRREGVVARGRSQQG